MSTTRRLVAEKLSILTYLKAAVRRNKIISNGVDGVILLTMVLMVSMVAMVSMVLIVAIATLCC